MAFDDIDPGALLSRTYRLPDGLSVRLRLPHAADRLGVTALLARHGLPVGELEVTRLLRHDPRRRSVIFATALVAGTETVVGVGAIDSRPGAGPDLLVVDETAADGLVELLDSALRARARRAASRAA